MPGSGVVVVTGASAGVGRATVRAFAGRGYDVGLLARGRDALDAAAEEVAAAGRQAVVVPADVADPAQVEEAAARVEDELGPVAVWVNNAMTSVFAPFVEVDDDEFRRVTEVAYLGVVYGTRAALRYMLPRDRGVIVQVGSALAYRGIPLQWAYCAAKHAVQGFTESVRCELLHDRSRVALTMVQMPALDTPQFGWVLSRLPNEPQPVPPIYRPEIAARAVVHAAEHPRRREWWIGASTVATLVGDKVLPGTLDRYLAPWPGPAAPRRGPVATATGWWGRRRWPQAPDGGCPGVGGRPARASRTPAPRLRRGGSRRRGAGPRPGRRGRRDRAKPHRGSRRRSAAVPATGSAWRRCPWPASPARAGGSGRRYG